MVLCEKTLYLFHTAFGMGVIAAGYQETDLCGSVGLCICSRTIVFMEPAIPFFKMPSSLGSMTLS